MEMLVVATELKRELYEKMKDLAGSPSFDVDGSRPVDVEDGEVDHLGHARILARLIEVHMHSPEELPQHFEDNADYFPPVGRHRRLADPFVRRGLIKNLVPHLQQEPVLSAIAAEFNLVDILSTAEDERLGRLSDSELDERYGKLRDKCPDSKNFRVGERRSQPSGEPRTWDADLVRHRNAPILGHPTQVEHIWGLRDWSAGLYVPEDGYQLERPHTKEEKLAIERMKKVEREIWRRALIERASKVQVPSWPEHDEVTAEEPDAAVENHQHDELLDDLDNLNELTEHRDEQAQRTYEAVWELCAFIAPSREVNAMVTTGRRKYSYGLSRLVKRVPMRPILDFDVAVRADVLVDRVVHGMTEGLGVSARTAVIVTALMLMEGDSFRKNYRPWFERVAADEDVGSFPTEFDASVVDDVLADVGMEDIGACVDWFVDNFLGIALKAYQESEGVLRVERLRQN